MAEKTTEYHLLKLKEDKEYTFELRTTTNSVVPISMAGLGGLSQQVKPTDKRAANMMELLQLANIALGQGADPYARECGLMPVYTGGFHYEVWVAAQVRLRKVQSQNDYNGYRWGWITKDLVRHEPGPKSQANPDQIIGILSLIHI